MRGPYLQLHNPYLLAQKKAQKLTRLSSSSSGSGFFTLPPPPSPFCLCVCLCVGARSSCPTKVQQIINCFTQFVWAKQPMCFPNLQTLSNGSRPAAAAAVVYWKRAPQHFLMTPVQLIKMTPATVVVLLFTSLANQVSSFHSLTLLLLLIILLI